MQLSKMLLLIRCSNIAPCNFDYYYYCYYNCKIHLRAADKYLNHGSSYQTITTFQSLARRWAAGPGRAP